MVENLNPHLDIPYPHQPPLGNLPYQVTRFIGREQALAAVKQLMVTSRLLTLTGPGGCGKTRLALEVASRLSPMFSYGVWLVELADISDPAIVAEIAAAGLGLRQTPGASMEEMLIDYLRAREVLLIMDNCEHLADTCARMASTLLRVCPHLHILATSRESLSIAGEVGGLYHPCQCLTSTHSRLWRTRLPTWRTLTRSNCSSSALLPSSLASNLHTRMQWQSHRSAIG